MTDLETFADWLWKYSPGVHELRVLNSHGRRAGTRSGYFDNPETFVTEATRMSEEMAEGVYVTLNPCKPELLARAANRIRDWAKDATSDPDIIELRLFLVDFDPVRPSGISSTNEEHDLAIQRARAYFDACDGPAMLVDSGNGAQVIQPIQLPAGQAKTVQTALLSLAAQYDDDRVKVDRGVHNPSRIFKVAGTMVRKGDDMPERPWREARILDTRAADEDATDMVTRLSSSKRVSVDAPAVESNASGPLADLEDFLDRNAVILGIAGASDLKDWTSTSGDDGKRVEIDCIADESHGKSAFVVLREGETRPYATCHHNSCDWTWADLRAHCAQTEPLESMLDETVDKYEQIQAFVPKNPEEIRPPRQKTAEPFWYELAYGILWGPSGHAKSLVVDAHMCDLSLRGEHSFLFDSEDADQELERLQRLGADVRYTHVVPLSEDENLDTFGTPGFVERVIATLRQYNARFVAFNCYDDLRPPVSAGEPDAWNGPVREVSRQTRRIIHEARATVFILDHQEDTEAEHAHGGKMKKRSCDLYLRCTLAEPMPEEPNEPRLVNIRDMRKSSRLVVAQPLQAIIKGDREGPLSFNWTAEPSGLRLPRRTIEQPAKEQGWYR